MRAFRNEASGYGFAANSQLPSFLRMHTSIVQNEDSTDSDMLAMECGWRNGKNAMESISLIAVFGKT